MIQRYLLDRTTGHMWGYTKFDANIPSHVECDIDGKIIDGSPPVYVPSVADSEQVRRNRESLDVYWTRRAWRERERKEESRRRLTRYNRINVNARRAKDEIKRMADTARGLIWGGPAPVSETINGQWGRFKMIGPSQHYWVDFDQPMYRSLCGRMINTNPERIRLKDGRKCKVCSKLLEKAK